jgi:hypothetical protein
MEKFWTKLYEISRYWRRFFYVEILWSCLFSISHMPGSMSKFKCCTLSCLYESKLILFKVTTLIIVALDISVVDWLAALCLISLLERVNSVKKLSDFFSFLLYYKLLCNLINLIFLWDFFWPFNPNCWVVGPLVIF